MKIRTAVTTALCTAVFAPIFPASAAVVMDWDASTWSGIDGEAWVDSVAGIAAGKGANAPIKGSTILNGTSVDVITFTTDSFDVNAIDHPLVGLKEFSISIVFSTTSAGAAPENNSYQWNGLVGKELPGAGVGDWTVGFTAGGLVAGGASLGTGDVGTPSLGSVQNTGFHTVSFVLDDNGDNTHSQYLYLDGVLQSSDLNISYGGLSSVAASNFAIGARRDGDNGFSDSDIARLRFDDTALSQSEVSALHSTYLGEAIPEPTSALLVLVGGVALIARRRRSA